MDGVEGVEPPLLPESVWVSGLVTALPPSLESPPEPVPGFGVLVSSCMLANPVLGKAPRKVSGSSGAVYEDSSQRSRVLLGRCGRQVRSWAQEGRVKLQAVDGWVVRTFTAGALGPKVGLF